MAETRKLAAILAADVAGYSRLTGADEEGTLRRLRALRAELVDPAIEANRGRIVKTTGDGLLLEFGSVVDAVRCAIDVQKGMAARGADFLPEKRIEFRIGIHLGDVMVEADGDLLGDGVNIAARLEGISEPGGICLSEDAWRQVRDKIGERFADLGERELKNIARPVRVYAVAPHSFFPSPPRGGGEGRDEVGDSRARTTTSPLRAAGAGPSLSATRRGEDGPPRLSIVVLPFANIGGDPEQDYFVDGVTEDLTTELSRLAGAFVIARNTAFTYKGKPVDVKEIGRDLGVRYVLEGSVRRGGNRLRTNVQLIDTESGAHLWAERFDKPVADLFDMQDEIVARLANQLNAELTAAEARRAEKSPDPDSMDLYFQGMASLNKGRSPDSLAQTRTLFERALALDPANVDAMVGRARVDAGMVAGNLTDDRAALLAAAEAILTTALSLAPNHALGHMTLGHIYILSSRAAQGIAESEQALSLDRNLAHAYANIGLAKVAIGRAEEAEAHILEAFRLSPRDVQSYIWAMLTGIAKLYLGDDEGAAAWERRSIETNRNFSSAHFLLASALARLGRWDEARIAAQTGLALDPAFTIRRLRAVMIGSWPEPAALLRIDRILDAMRQAGVPEG